MNYNRINRAMMAKIVRLVDAHGQRTTNALGCEVFVWSDGWSDERLRAEVCGDASGVSLLAIAHARQEASGVRTDREWRQTPAGKAAAAEAARAAADALATQREQASAGQPSLFDPSLACRLDTLEATLRDVQASLAALTLAHEAQARRLDLVTSKVDSLWTGLGGPAPAAGA